MRAGRIPEYVHPCMYLPGRVANNEHYLVDSIQPGEMDLLLSLGFRLFGQYLFRPACEACFQCVPIRVPVVTFQPSQSQRRLIRDRKSLEVRVGEPRFTEEKFLLYREHEGRFGDGERIEQESFIRSYYRNAARTLEFEYLDGGQLMGVGFVLAGSRSASSTYFFYGKAGGALRLGIFSLLYELDWCRGNGMLYHYLGYTVPGNSRMVYKQWFRPNEIALGPGCWVPFRAAGKKGTSAQDPARITFVPGSSPLLA